MPDAANFTNSRFRFPPTQRSPSPNGTATPSATSPCRKMHGTVGSTFSAVSRSVSGTVVPADVRIPPPVVPEFSQPCPAAPLLPQGHADPVPSPKQNDAPGATPPEGTLPDTVTLPPVLNRP